MSKAPLFTIALEVNIVGLNEITGALREITAELHEHRHSHPKPHISGGRIVIIVKDNNPDVNYAISGVEAKDAEGNAIPDAKLAYEVTSTDDSVVSVTPDAADATKGAAHFGAPGVATVNVQVKAEDGTLLGSFAQPFTVTTGDPASIVGGAIAFGDLKDQA